MLLVEKADGVAVVTLNRPEAMNALSKELRALLHDAITDLDADPDVRAIILTGAGERAFTAGLDLKELGSGRSDTKPEKDPVKALETCSKPIVGAINGVAITGGFEVALACDVLIASENARFADTHVRVGILPTWGLSQKLSRAVGVYRAKELSLSGNFLNARMAYEWGLVNRVVPAADLMSAARTLASDMASAPANTVALYKRVIDQGFSMPLGTGLLHEYKTFSQHNRQVTSEMVEARRGAIQARGRSQ